MSLFKFPYFLFVVFVRLIFNSNACGYDLKKKKKVEKKLRILL